MNTSKIWSKPNSTDIHIDIEKRMIDIANVQKIDQISNIVKKEKKNKKTEMTEVRSPTSYRSSPRLNDIDNIERIYRPRIIRISKVSVSIPIGRNKTGKKKRRSVSSFITRGVVLPSIPENEELYNFDTNLY
jgi:hypothetical protein